MIRATGFLLGTLLMLAVFLFVLGDGIFTSPVPAPDSHAAAAPPPPEEPATENPHRDNNSHRAAVPTPPAEPVTTGEQLEEAVVDNVESPVAETASADEKDSPEVASSGLELDPETWDASLAAYEKVSRNDILPDSTVTASRYRVWSPFRSKWAAEGFAQRLTLATAVPLEVINDKPGNYQVVLPGGLQLPG